MFDCRYVQVASKNIYSSNSDSESSEEEEKKKRLMKAKKLDSDKVHSNKMYKISFAWTFSKPFACPWVWYIYLLD